jgi:L-alanine-DL-glutamate epimerase-like enolase superfamily enzyme
MRIETVEAIPLRAAFPEGTRYWGDVTWTRSAAVEARTEPLFRGDLYTEYPLRWRMRHGWERAVSTVIVRLASDDGLVGYGEAKGVIVPRAVTEIVEHVLADVVRGADPFDVDVLWHRMYARMRGRGHLQGFMQEAMAGVDIALWDLMGKATGRPICALLGGRYRREMRVYASALPGLPAGWTPDDEARLATAAQTFRSRGFTAMKVGIGYGIDADVRSVEVVRDATDADTLILADALGSYDLPAALRLGQRLSELRVGWFETPLPPEDLDGYVQLGKHLPLPVANDFVFTSRALNDLLRRGARIVLQPEVIKAGISECRRIALLADLYDLPYAPHVSIGSAIQFAATAHLAASCPNFMISEFWAGENPLGNAILREPLFLHESHLQIPDGPGLGIELDEQKWARYRLHA